MTHSDLEAPGFRTTPSFRFPFMRTRTGCSSRRCLTWAACERAGWRSSLVIAQPATVLAWHRQGFQLYWRWKSRRRSAGRPPIDREIRTLIGKTQERGYTLVPTRLYFKGSRAKLELGLAKGKKLHDKRRAMADKEARREMERGFKERQRPDR